MYRSSSFSDYYSGDEYDELSPKIKPNIKSDEDIINFSDYYSGDDEKVLLNNTTEDEDTPDDTCVIQLTYEKRFEIEHYIYNLERAGFKIDPDFNIKSDTELILYHEELICSIQKESEDNELRNHIYLFLGVLVHKNIIPEKEYMDLVHNKDNLKTLQQIIKDRYSTQVKEYLETGDVLNDALEMMMIAVFNGKR